MFVLVYCSRYNDLFFYRLAMTRARASLFSPHHVLYVCYAQEMDRRIDPLGQCDQIGQFIGFWATF